MPSVVVPRYLISHYRYLLRKLTKGLFTVASRYNRSIFRNGTSGLVIVRTGSVHPWRRLRFVQPKCTAVGRYSPNVLRSSRSRSTRPYGWHSSNLWIRIRVFSFILSENINCVNRRRKATVLTTVFLSIEQGCSKLISIISYRQNNRTNESNSKQKQNHTYHYRENKPRKRTIWMRW